MLIPYFKKGSVLCLFRADACRARNGAKHRREIGMVGESFIITGLLLIAAASLLRSKRKKWAIATLPLTVLPAVNALVGFFGGVILKLKIGFVTNVCIIMGAMIVSCTRIGFLTATLLNRRKARIPYKIGCIAFNIILAAVFMGYYYSVLMF